MCRVAVVFCNFESPPLSSTVCSVGSLSFKTVDRQPLKDKAEVDLLNSLAGIFTTRFDGFFNARLGHFAPKYMRLRTAKNGSYLAFCRGRRVRREPISPTMCCKDRFSFIMVPTRKYDSDLRRWQRMQRAVSPSAQTIFNKGHHRRG